MKSIWKMLRGNRRSRKQRTVHGKPIFENLEPRLLLNAVPYIQDFSLGKPDAAAGWDYYSDNEGRIEVVSGRLQMDDTADNSIYSSNEAILHVDLTGRTGVTLTLDHWSLGDENDALPDSFTGHYKGDGIALSVDGLNWVKVTDLTIDFTNQSFKLDSALEQAKIAANSTDVSDVQIKFQQYDNYPESLDGRQFDNIKIQATTVVAQAVPYLQDFTMSKPDAAAGWEYYSDNEGRIDVVSGRLRMDDIAGNGTYSSNEAILHVNLTNTTGVTLTLDHWSLNDENDPLPASFFGRYKGDGISLSVDGQNWVKVTDLTVNFTNQSFNLDAIIQQAKTAAGSTDVSNVRIKFQQYDNYSATTDGREFDNIKVKATLIGPEIDVLGNGIIIVDGDTTPSSIDHTDFGSVQQGSSTLRTFTIMNTGTAALNITGIQCTGSTDFSVIQLPASVVAAYGGTTIFKIQFTPTKSGLHTATIQITNNDTNENPYDFVIQGTGLVTPIVPQAIPYIQTFSLGKPDGSSGWEYYSDNEGRIQVVNGRLRMDDTTDNTIYSLNEAILHVNLTGKTGVTLTLDHWSLADEVDTIIPNNFTGHYKGDGIALSVDGLNWVKVADLNFTNKTFNLDTLLQQAKIAAGSTDVSNVRIKFQQYDNYSANTDGREIDNIIVNFGANQAPVISSVTASPSVISDTETSQLQVVAYDPDSGPNPLTYTWSVPAGAGSLNNLNIVNPIYTPPDVTGTQTFTLTVKVSDGAAITSKTVDITVTDTIPVNQAPVILSVTASPSTISDAETSQLQVVAYDPDSGPNPLTYTWSVPVGAGSLNNANIVNPIYTPPDVTATQTFTLTVSVSDGLAITSKTVNITVTDSGPGPQILLSEDFNDGNYNGWILVDQGNLAGPMAWSAATGVMVQSSNVHTTTVDGVARLGTYAYWQAGSTWTDYTATAKIKSTDNDAIGIMFRYQDENNYYRFSWDKERNLRRLVKCVNGQFTILAEDSIPYVTGKDYQVKISAQGSLLQVSIDGSLVFSANDSSFSSGTIALYSWGNAGSYFDDILVEGVSGTNQAPVISLVTASPSVISDTETSQLQVVAYDPDSGPNPLTYTWTVPAGAGSLNNANIVNPIYTPPDVTATQTFTLTVSVSDGAAITSKTVDITVTDSGPGPQILLSEDFNDGNYNGWILVDQGNLAGPMAWSAATGVMVQSSNVHTTTVDGVARLGTYAYWQAGSGWTDYTASAKIKSTDNDAIGIMFRYQDENNYYRFSWDKERNLRRLVKCVNGQFTILAEDSVPYVTGKDYQVKISAQGSLLQVSIDGSLIFSVNDSSFSSGTIALYSWGNAGSYFDDILVEGVSGTNQAPVISLVTASPSIISDAETSQLQVVAYDPDSGPNPLTYTWSVPAGAGSLDNANIVNPIYTPPDVTATQTFTLTVSVSDGVAITSKTVDITVTDAGPGPQILLSEDFNDGNYNGWSLVDQGNLAGPMAWSAATGVMVQSSNVHTTTVDGVARLGTYAYWQAGSGWTDYTASAKIKSTDNDAIGIMFRYQDENNYYRFSWDKERNLRRLIKCVNGQFTVLAEDSVPYVTGQEYQVKISAQGSLLQVSIDGSLIFSVNDSSFSSGTIALYSWGNAGSYFDDILVTK